MAQTSGAMARHGSLLRAVLRTLCVASPTLLAGALPLAAQGVVIVRAGPGGRVSMTPGTRVSVPMIIDMSHASGVTVAALSAGVTWSPTQMTLDSVVAGPFGNLTYNDASAASGNLTLSLFDANGTTTTATFGTLWFTTTAGASTVTITPTALGDQGGGSILPQARVARLEACIAQGGLWGDVNDDAVVSIIDAQQIARASVGLPVANAAALATRGDATGDGQVNILDAQQIARFSVGLSAAAKINTPLFTPPGVASLTISHVYASNFGAYNPSGQLPVVGGRLSIGVTNEAVIVPVARDGSNADVTACTTFSYTPSTPAATATSGGVISMVAPGSPDVVVGTGGPSASASFAISATLAIDTQPGGAASGVNLTTQPVVSIRSATGAVLTGLNGYPVTVIRSAGTSGSLSGTTTVNTVNGVATFTNLKITASPGNVALTFQSAGSPDVTSGTFAVTGPLFTALTTTNTTCGIASAGAAYCWGNNNSAQIGDGTITARAVPTAVLGGIAFSGISASIYHTCGVSTAGAGYCWGNNSGGELGNGTFTTRESSPVAVTGGLTFSTIVTGAASLVSGWSCGLTTAGAAYCWGQSIFDGSLTSSAQKSNVPVAVGGGLVFTSLVAGDLHVCGLTASGAAYCWGSNARGQGGTGTAGGFTTTPVAVSGGLTFASLAAGGIHTCGLTSTGAAYCWGVSAGAAVGPAVGGLGDGTTADRPAPTAVIGGLLFSGIAAGGNHTCALTSSDGTLYCWGINGNGAAGQPLNAVDGGSVSAPTAVNTGLKFTSVVAGGTNSCAVATTGAAYCWGNNQRGQIGDGTTNGTHATPTAVLFP